MLVFCNNLGHFWSDCCEILHVACSHEYRDIILLDPCPISKRLATRWHWSFEHLRFPFGRCLCSEPYSSLTKHVRGLQSIQTGWPHICLKCDHYTLLICHVTSRHFEFENSRHFHVDFFINSISWIPCILQALKCINNIVSDILYNV